LYFTKKVPTIARLNVPNPPDQMPNAPFEFGLYIAFDGKKWLMGKPALALDGKIPLKTILLYLAGVSVRSVTGYEPFRRAVKSGRLTRPMMMTLARQHYAIVIRASELQAKRAGVALTVLCVTYPNILSETENDDDRDKYVGFLCDNILKPLCPNICRVESISESQAVGLYDTEEFDDAYHITASRLEPRNAFCRVVDSGDTERVEKPIVHVNIDIGSGTTVRGRLVCPVDLLLH
jgi:hypothetical protein